MIKVAILLILLPLGISSAFNLLCVLGNLLNKLDPVCLFFLGGSLFSLIIVAKFRKQLEFFSTFEHELTHNLWAMIFFKKPKGFHVNNDGSGLFEYKSGGHFSNIFILLSPYFFPTSCFLWLPFHIMCKEEYYWFYFLMMGIFFGYQIMSTIQETRTYQTDITTYGISFSYATFIPLYIFFHGIILSHLNEGFGGVIKFIYSDNIANVEYMINLL